jgi:hypothetical protein
MWAAYEEWMNRGISQYFQVAVELERFYSFLRRRAMARRRGETDLIAQRAEIAEAAAAYLTSVRDVARKAVERHDREIDELLARLAELTP